MSSPPQGQVPLAENNPLPTTKQLSGPAIKYPPFPPVPEGVKITPFKDFKEHGIQMFSGDEEVEVDGLGIPTVPLRVPHGTDEGKTEARKRAKNPLVASHPPPPSPPRHPDGRPIHPRAQMMQSRKEWWQFWQEGEDLRITAYAYNPNMSRMDRIYQASADFRMGRPWPPAHTQILYLWDQFRIFVGLLGVTPVWTRTDRPQENLDDESISDDESDLEAQVNPRKKVYVQDRPEEYRKKKAYPIPVDSDEAVRELLDAENVRKEEQLMNFLNDPELYVKIFFSWYMRREGLLWSDRYLEALPRLVLFFLNFLLRNQVLPEKLHERGLRRAVVVASQAFKELPLTSKVSKRLPDDFSLSCMALWEDELRQKEPESDAAGSPTEDPLKKFEEELKAVNMQLIEPNDDMTPDEAVKEILEDNIDGIVEDDDDYDPTSFKLPPTNTIHGVHLTHIRS
ncbi:hypothetical protein BDQ17DRAFT_1427286 [Cyathus striatus]|nr:hypothetical protein BDQ17DRAFT_1427286 [Cyathus striatus]